MCGICERAVPGAIFTLEDYNGTCGICGAPICIDKFTATWIGNGADVKGNYCHVFEKAHTCPNCGDRTNLGVFCTGIKADGIFIKKPEMVDLKGKQHDKEK